MAPGVDAAESHTTPPRAAANNANGDHVQPADAVAATMDVHSGRSLPQTTMNREKRIRVCVRVRPFARNEAIRTGGKAAWTWHGNTIYQQIFPAQAPTRKARTDSGANATSSANAASNAHLPSSYSVDHLYGPTANTSQLYDDAVRDSIAAAVEGYHSSVFVYGQTGTGKTHTMLGTRAEPGLIQLAVEDIFGLIARHGESEFLLRFSYLEIYNERVHDLLAGGVRKDVKIYEVARQDAENDGTDSNTPNDIVVKGLDEQVVVSVEQVIALVEAGNVHRHTATTDANDNSSRSHTIFRLVIESQAKGGSTGVARSATLNLIDLAGSESVRLANTSGNHVEEGRHINRSLLTLGHIIWKLSRGGRSSSGKSSNDLMHLPYRNSKLTRILQPALGGKAQITIVCTVAPSVECLAETHNTLKFATRARRVKSRLALNEATGESALLKKYRTRMKELQDEWDELERRKSNATNGSIDVAAIETLQFELQFAIENINRVILNSSHRHGTTLANGKEGPSDSSGQDSNNDEVEGEDDDDATDDEFKESLVIKPSQSFKQRFMLTAGEPESATAAAIQRRNLTVLSDDSARSLQSIAQRRASLTTVLKTKYINELSQFEEDEDAYRETALSALSAPLHNPTHRELLREFVRGLEIAEAEHETRLSQIHELELENHHLRELLRERDEELAAMRARIA